MTEAPGALGTALVLFLASSQAEVELPVSVHVFSEADGDNDEGEALADTTDEVREKMEARKSKFRVVESSEEAVMVVELLRLWEEEAAKTSYQPMNTNDPERAPIHEFLSVQKIQLAEIEVRVGEDPPVRMTVSRPGRDPEDVADAVRRAVELHLVQYR